MNGMDATRAATIIRDDPEIQAILEKAEAINLALSYLNGEKEEANRYLEGISDGYKQYEELHCWYESKTATPRVGAPVIIRTEPHCYFAAKYTDRGTWETFEGTRISNEAVVLWKFIEEMR